MKRILFFSIFVAFFLITVSQVKAEEKLVFDSTDNYLGACQLTDKSEWEIKEDLNVTKFEVWYSWNQGETTLPVKVYFNGEKFAEFDAARGNCDPYQRQWCNADYNIDKLFPKGTYTTEIPDKRQCLKPGGTGAIRLYAEDGEKKEVVPSATTAPTATEAIANQVKPTEVVANKTTGCSCNQTTIVITAVVTSVVSSLLVSLLLRR